ncbi:MAG: hypothetical protein J6I73_00245 [Treponema sp.]|nr:hypothetical protein [Treponema sp.]
MLVSGIPFTGTKDNTIDGVIYAQCYYEYSGIRAYLNGGVYKNDSKDKNDHVGKGFLDTAFAKVDGVTSGQELTETGERIAETEIYNSVSTSHNNSFTNEVTKEGETSTFFSDTPIKDKIFLLSYKDFIYSKYFKNNAARKKTGTDYAIATGYRVGGGFAESWWLRTPEGKQRTYTIASSGAKVVGTEHTRKFVGVVPALCLEKIESSDPIDPVEP